MMTFLETAMGESVESAMRGIRNEILEEAARAAEANAPKNEPGEYWHGRRDAADTIRQLKT